MDRYATAIFATRTTKEGTEVKCAPAVISATSTNEAVERALHVCRTIYYPTDDGWTGHKASVMKIRIPNIKHGGKQ